MKRDPSGARHVAVLNVALLTRAQRDEENAEFNKALPHVMGLAEAGRGFCWRFSSVKDGPGDQRYQELSALHPGDRALFNLSVWESVGDLKHFMFKSGHAPYMRRKKVCGGGESEDGERERKAHPTPPN